MITFRQATCSELDLILDWAAAEGWNPGIDDARAFYAADPKGFFLAVDGDTLVGSISVVNHNPEFAFLGLYIVKPSHRGKSIGYDLWNHGIRHAGHRTIGLDGVPEQQSNYAVSGFQKSGKTVRYSGIIKGTTCHAMRLATAADTDDLIDGEADMSGTRKHAYMSAWFTNTKNRKTFVHPNGFVTVRQCREGVKIGPLVATDETAAAAMLKHACSDGCDRVMIDVPAQSQTLERLCCDLGLRPVFETARMYKGPGPTTRRSIYAVSSLELG